MEREDIDVDVSIIVKLRTMKPPTMAEEIWLRNEETRLSYYLDILADEIEEKIKTGKLILKDIEASHET